MATPLTRKTEWTSPYKDAIFKKDGSFDKFSIAIWPIHEENGYWLFWKDHEALAFSHGFRNPESILLAALRGDEYPMIIWLTWIPGQADAYQSVKIATVKEHILSIAEDRAFLDLPELMSLDIPFYPLDRLGILLEYRRKRYGLGDGGLQTSTRPNLSRHCTRCIEKRIDCDKMFPSCTRCLNDHVDCVYLEIDEDVTQDNVNKAPTTHNLEPMTVTGVSSNPSGTPIELESLDHESLPQFTPSIRRGQFSNSSSAYLSMELNPSIAYVDQFHQRSSSVVRPSQLALDEPSNLQGLPVRAVPSSSQVRGGNTLNTPYVSAYLSLSEHYQSPSHTHSGTPTLPSEYTGPSSVNSPALTGHPSPTIYLQKTGTTPHVEPIQANPKNQNSPTDVRQEGADLTRNDLTGNRFYEPSYKLSIPINDIKFNPDDAMFTAPLPCIDCSEVGSHKWDCNIGNIQPLHLTRAQLELISDSVQRFDPEQWREHRATPPTPKLEDYATKTGEMAAIIRNDESYKMDPNLHNLSDDTLLFCWAMKSSNKVNTEMIWFDRNTPYTLTNSSGEEEENIDARDV